MAIDPSRISIDEPDDYIKHVQERLAASKRHNYQKHQAGDNTSEQMRAHLIRMED